MPAFVEAKLEFVQIRLNQLGLRRNGSISLNRAPAKRTCDGPSGGQAGALRTWGPGPDGEGGPTRGARFVHRAFRRSPGSAISLLNSRALPTCYLAGVAETQLLLPIPCGHRDTRGGAVRGGPWAEVEHETRFELIDCTAIDTASLRANSSNALHLLPRRLRLLRITRSSLAIRPHVGKRNRTRGRSMSCVSVTGEERRQAARR